MSVQYADDASKWALRQFWWSVSVPTLLKRSPPNCCAPNSPRKRRDRFAIRSWDVKKPQLSYPWPSKGLEPTESEETLVVTSAQAKVGGEGGVDLLLFGWASLATFWSSDLRADTALLVGATTIDAAICESLRWGTDSLLHGKVKVSCLQRQSGKCPNTDTNYS